MSAPFSPTREQIDAVQDWRQRRSEARIAEPIVPLLVRRFGLNALQAIACIRAANDREAADAND
jgi:hypothetical protein